jgi:hypothetical protein
MASNQNFLFKRNIPTFTPLLNVTGINLSSSDYTDGLESDVRNFLIVSENNEIFVEAVKTLAISLYGTGYTQQQYKLAAKCVSLTIKNSDHTMLASVNEKLTQTLSDIKLLRERISTDKTACLNDCSKAYSCAAYCYLEGDAIKTSTGACSPLGGGCGNLSKTEEEGWMDCLRGCSIQTLGMFAVLSTKLKEAQDILAEKNEVIKALVDIAATACKNCPSCVETGTSAN